MGTDVLGADEMHHFEKLELVMRLSYALTGVSVVELHGVPVAVTVPPSVRSGLLLLPQTLAVPPPPQVCGDVQVPQELTVREVPQLSLAVTVPQFLPRREQNALSLSGVQPPPSATGLFIQVTMSMTGRMRTSGLVRA